MGGWLKEKEKEKGKGKGKERIEFLVFGFTLIESPRVRMKLLFLFFEGRFGLVFLVDF